jgi:hypothetical protein
MRESLSARTECNEYCGCWDTIEGIDGWWDVWDGRVSSYWIML